jgi:Domain of unknown function (DUF4166)
MLANVTDGRFSPASVDKPIETSRPQGFEDLLAPSHWARLPSQIRQRFSCHIKVGQSRLYSGRVLTTHLSFLGQILAYLLVPFGAPLPLHETVGGEAAIVAVTADTSSKGQGAQVWSRQYSRSGGFPQTIYSTKRFAGPTGLEERLGPGLGEAIGMSLSLSSDDKALHFISQRYFLWLFGIRIWLPKWLEPGQMVVSHEIVNATQFIFRLKLTHPLFGVLVEQACLFHDTQEV